ncbi:MAG: hypothetical protein IKQ46_16205 [Bacteroidales bacterium]|nr:hypothetical protein [Bacteroidales bacterium]
MEIYNIKRNLTRFRNGEAITFLQLVQRAAESVTDESIKEKFENFKTKLSEFVDNNKLENTKRRSKELEMLLTEISQRYNFLRNSAKSAFYFTDPKVIKVASIINHAMLLGKKFKSRDVLTLLCKYTTTISAIRENADAELLKSTLYDDIISEIEKLIEKYSEAYLERNEYRAYIKHRASESRKEVEKAYYDLTVYLNSMANLGDNICKDIVEDINETIIWVKRKKSHHEDIEDLDDITDIKAIEDNNTITEDIQTF